MGTISYVVPVPGVDLNSVADPEIATALTTLLTFCNGGIDLTNLSAGLQAIINGATYSALKPVSVGVNTTAVSGNLYRVTATATITLPSHSSGQVVGIANASGTTTVSGTLIQGAGLSSASSFTLGTPGAAVILVDDGTNWIFVAGQQDTGWVPFTAGTNVTLENSPGLRLIGSIVFVRFRASNSANISNGVAWATFPATFAPANSAIFPATNAGLGNVFYEMSIGGTSVVSSITINSGADVGFTASYPLTT